MDIKKVANTIGVGITSAWKFFQGKKRWIAMGAGLLARAIPSHTAVGQGASWLSDNLEYVSIGLDVTAGLFGTAAVAEVLKDKLPSGLSKKKEGEQ